MKLITDLNKNLEDKIHEAQAKEDQFTNEESLELETDTELDVTAGQLQRGDKS